MDDPVLSTVSASPRPLPSFSKKKDGFSRTDVVEAFQRAFDMIGGVQRLALWGNSNPTEFYRLYAKLLPATSVNLGTGNTITIVHAVAPTALDRHEQPALVVDLSTGQPIEYASLEHAPQDE